MIIDIPSVDGICKISGLFFQEGIYKDFSVRAVYDDKYGKTFQLFVDSGYICNFSNLIDLISFVEHFSSSVR